MLKKSLLVLITLLFNLSISNAQDFSFGIKGGGSLVKMKFENLNSDYETNYGFSFGIMEVYRSNQLLSLEADLLYSQKGTKYLIEQIYHTTYTLEYLSLPILAKLYLPEISFLKTHLDLGPSFNYLISYQKEIQVQYDPNKTYLFYYPSPIDYNKNLNSFDMGLIAGLGFDCQLFSHTISLDTRYEIGLTDINKDLGNGSIKNRTFSLFLGYLF
ncbi:MAG: porin family protein [Clostridiales bacterium]